MRLGRTGVVSGTRTQSPGAGLLLFLVAASQEPMEFIQI